MTNKVTGRREKIGNRLAILRQARDLTQGEVARFMDLDVSTISKHEVGDRRMSPEQARLYSNLYRCTLLEVFLDPADVYDAG